MSGMLTWSGLGIMVLCNTSINVLWFCVMVLKFCVKVFMFWVMVLILSSHPFCFSFRMSNFSSNLHFSTRTNSSLSTVLLFFISSFKLFWLVTRDLMSSIFSICSFNSTMVLDIVCGGVYFDAILAFEVNFWIIININ